MFRFKPDKLRDEVPIFTLDETHRKYINAFRENRMMIAEKTSKIVELEKNIITTDMSANELAKNRIMIDKLKEEIYDATHNVSEINYYSKIDDILLEYYALIGKNTPITQNCTQNTNINKRCRSRCERTGNTTNIIDLLRGEPDAGTPCTTQVRRYDKAMLHAKYVKSINDHTNNGKIFKTQFNSINFCDKCGIERTLHQSEGFYICDICGESECGLVVSDIPNYRENGQEKPLYPYKRLNHLVEWLNQFQAKESTDIPDSVYDIIRGELRKMRMYNLEHLTLNDVKSILRKLKLHQYYEHTPHITCKLSKRSPPTLSREQEEKIKSMFKEIQEPFAKYCPSNRTNFLSYSYVLHKFFQLLGLHEYTSHFPLLKSREKLRLQDELWKKICNELKWDFHPSA